MVSVMGTQVLFHHSHHKERNMGNSLYLMLLKKPVSVTDHLQDMFLWVYRICKLPFYADYNYQQIRTSYVSQSQALSPPPAPAHIPKSFPLHGSGCCKSGRPTVMMTVCILTNMALRSQPCTKAVLWVWPQPSLFHKWNVGLAVLSSFQSYFISLSLFPVCIIHQEESDLNKSKKKKMLIKDIWWYDKAGYLTVWLTPLFYLD